MKILVVDLETTSHDPTIDDMRNLENSIISEIGIVRLDLETGKTEPVFDSVCREEKTCSAQSWIFENSSLTYEDVLSADHFQVFKDELQEIFDQDYATSWWQEYDFNRLEHPSRGISIQYKFWDPAITLRTYLKIHSRMELVSKDQRLPKHTAIFTQTECLIILIEHYTMLRLRLKSYFQQSRNGLN